MVNLSIFEKNESKHNMREFKKYFKLDASPSDIYNAFTNPVMIEIWSGEPAVMSTEPGSEFSLWDGEITGQNIEFVQDQKIVQHWFFGEESDSVVTIKLHPDKKGTNVEVHQTNIPDDAYDNMVEGWESDYFGSLRELFD
jgi:activator of HSP90 ATPase